MRRIDPGELPVNCASACLGGQGDGDGKGQGAWGGHASCMLRSQWFESQFVLELELQAALHWVRVACATLLRN